MLSVRRASRLGVVALRISLLAALVFVAAMVMGRVSVTAALLAAIPLAATLTAGVAFAETGVFAQPVVRGRTDRKELALTFDDGPDPRWTPPLLDLLDREGHKATFFVIGVRASAQRELIAEMARRGHEIANHTWSHSNLTAFVAPARLARDLVATSDVIEAATGARPRWFRAPVGLLSPRIPIAAKRANLDIAHWSATARDGVARTSVANAVAHLKPAISAGAILVLHDARLGGRDGAGDTPPIACEVLRELSVEMKSKGLKSVTLSRLCFDD